MYELQNMSGVTLAILHLKLASHSMNRKSRLISKFYLEQYYRCSLTYKGLTYDFLTL